MRSRAIDQPWRQALRALHRADDRAGIRRVAVRVGEIRGSKREIHRLQPVAAAEPDRHRHERAIRDRVVRRRILDVPAILYRTGDLLGRRARVSHREDKVQRLTVRRQG